MKESELKAILRNPCLLNLVGAILSLKHLYDVIGNPSLKNAYGHYLAFLLFGLGFLLSLPHLWSAEEIEQINSKRLTAIRARGLKWPYRVFFFASLILFISVTCDAFKCPEIM